jgi:sensor histidine kinase regulating citrate/malate metabolism
MNNLSDRADTKQKELELQAHGIIAQTHEEHLKLLAKPFIWAIRSEMMKGNNSQIDLYMNEMVKEKNFQRIIVVNSKGTVMSSTNKKDEGKPFSTVDNTSKLNAEDTVIQNQGDSVLTMLSPVMGFNNRLGTLYVQYNVPKTSLK